MYFYMVIARKKFTQSVIISFSRQNPVCSSRALPFPDCNDDMHAVTHLDTHFDTRLYARVISSVAAKAFTRLYTAVNSAAEKFFTNVLFHSAYNKLTLHPKMGKQRNHNRIVIHTWISLPACTLLPPLVVSPDASSSAFYNYIRDDLTPPIWSPPSTATPSTPRSADPVI